MTYRLRMILGKWCVLEYNADGTHAATVEHDKIAEAQAYAASTGYRDGDR